jgi:hypothetical protein
MKVYTLPNLSSHVITEQTDAEVARFKNPRPFGMTKQQFRDWSTAPNTEGCFLSVWSGVNPKARVASNNPATRLHGIIADFDSPKAHDHLPNLLQAVGTLPKWVYSTFTAGKVRLVWEFEAPVNVTCPELTERFLKALDAKVRFSKALPGYDKSSTDSTQLFEVGSNWLEIKEADPIPNTMLEMAIIDAGVGAKLPTNDIEIPMEVIAAEVATRFPGRWRKPFEEGQRGPLFWIDDGIEREGCVITANGMVCFSDRAASNFLPWSTILGRAFVSKFEEETLGNAAMMFWHDGRSYFRKHGEAWSAFSREDARLHLKVAGISDKPRRGQNASDIERVLQHIQLNRRVDAAVPIMFSEEDIVFMEGGGKYLNTNTRTAMEPAPEGTGTPENFPWIWNLLENGFCDGHADKNKPGGHPEPRSRDFFLGWLYWFWNSARECRLQPGQIIVLAGDIHTGKSFINRRLIGAIVGGSFEATHILMNASAFNKSAGEVGHWRCDDAPTDGEWREKARFSRALKAHASNPTVLYHPKFRDAIELPFLGRVCITCNLDPESLTILPTMDASFADKVSLFKIREDFRPTFHRTTHENEAMIEREIPFFLRWLKDWGDSGIPEGVVNHKQPRFGVKPYHHPDLVESSHAESFEYSVQEVLQIWATAKKKDRSPGAKTEFTATEILSELQADSGLSQATRQWNNRSLGKNLSKLIGKFPPLLGKRTLDKISRYSFNFNLCP